MKKSLLFCVVVGALFFAGCSQNVARFSLWGIFLLQMSKRVSMSRGKIVFGICLDSHLVIRKPREWCCGKGS